MGVAFKLRIFQEILVMGFFDWPIISKKHSHYEHIQIDQRAFLFQRGIDTNSPPSQVCFSNLYLTSAMHYSVSGGHNIGSLAYSYCCRAFYSCTQSALRLGHEYKSRIFGIWSLSLFSCTDISIFSQNDFNTEKSL